MKLTRSLLALALNLALLFPAVTILQVSNVSAQVASAALQRGYRTGYSDGYMSGYRDSIDSLSRSIARHQEYEKADRAYNKDYGSIEDYRDGYRQGFQIGYDTGYEKREFESSVPAGLARKGLSSIPNESTSTTVSDTTIQKVAINETPSSVDTNVATNDDQDNDVVDSQRDMNRSASNSLNVGRIQNSSDDDQLIIIPKDIDIVVELQEDLGTRLNREGEKFTAKVISPVEISGAIIEGRIEKLQMPGRLKRQAQMQLTFDRIVLRDARWSNFSGILTDIEPIKGDNIRRISDEGTAVGKSSLKQDGIKIGAATGTGAGIGAIAGGPVGAAIGAGIGAAFGVGAAVIDKGNHITLMTNQKLHIRSAYETRIK